MAANLISPVYYDFANGSYLVNQADKYVIRLSYEGIEQRYEPVDYEVIPIPQNNIQYSQLKNIIESYAEKDP